MRKKTYYDLSKIILTKYSITSFILYIKNIYISRSLIPPIIKFNPIIYSNFTPVLPIQPEYFTVSSPMGERKNPTTGEREVHYGIDIEVPGVEGQNVYSILPGVVSNISSDDRLGTYVVVKHGAMSTLYANLNPGDIRTIIGQRVFSGDVIGIVGNSGGEGKPLLHFEVDIDGERIDPLTIIGVKETE